MSFDEEKTNLINHKKGLKQVGAKKSMFDDKPKKINQQDFDKSVNSALNKMDDNSKTMADLSKSFIKILLDKTLPENKDIIAKSFEKESWTALIYKAKEINNDQNEEEGMGSLALCTLLFNCLLKQRDLINKLSYDVSMLEKKIKNNE